jgi:hypothetical protein
MSHNDLKAMRDRVEQLRMLESRPDDPTRRKT